ncbi:MAG: cache domain-containing protein [Sulfurospirillum sp.]
MKDLQQNETSLITKIFFLPIISTIIAVIIISAGYILVMQSIKHDELTKWSNHLLSEQKTLIKNAVVNLDQDIKNELSLSKLKTKQELKARVYQMSYLLEKLSKKYNNKELIYSILNSARYDNNKNYFFAYIRKTGVVKVHIFKKMIGKNVKYRILKNGISTYRRNERVLDNKEQEGYFKVYFAKPGTKEKKFEKIDFIKYIKNLDLVIGTGEYVDSLRNRLKKAVLHRVLLKRVKNNGYFFIVNTKGVLLSHPYLIDKIGKSILNIKDIDQKEFIKEMIEKTKNHSGGSFVSYKWKDPDTNKIEQKITYVKLDKKLGWIIGTGFYADKIYFKISKEKSKMESYFNQMNIYIFITLLLCLVPIGIISFLLSSHIRKTFDSYNYALKRQKQIARYEANHDILTGANNRTAFNKALEKELIRAKRYSRNLTIAMIDIDHFKVINDTYGHQTGDLVLKNLVLYCNSHIRKNDFFARWGGEEFMLIMIETNEKEAKKIAENLRIGIINDAKSEKSVKFTISIGIAQLDNKNDNMDSIIQKVDIALYNAKSLGRNRVEAFKEQT